MPLKIRDALPTDAAAVTRLMQALAQSEDYPSPITEAYVPHFLSHPGSGALLAEWEDRIVGLLCYTLVPNLFHAGDSCLIQELVVDSEYRGKSIGRSLMYAIIEIAKQHDCKEISISAMPDNFIAINLYKSVGLTEEAVYLETHL
ncbi:MAG: GNAT family N-acetyltransferase [Anaerolineales bacterium]|nr:GNAT family N-acetyltransferase [Anaerolineales bacterium]